MLVIIENKKKNLFEQVFCRPLCAKAGLLMLTFMQCCRLDGQGAYISQCILLCIHGFSE